MDRHVGRREALTVAALFAATAAMAGAVVYPETLAVAGFATLAAFVAVLFAPDTGDGGF